MIEPETFSIEWASDDPGPCSECSREMFKGPVGWRRDPEPGPLCEDCLSEKHSDLGLALDAAWIRRHLALEVAGVRSVTKGWSGSKADPLLFPLTPRDVAQLMDDCSELASDTINSLKSFVICSGQCERQLAYLELLVRDANLGLASSDGKYTTALECHEELHRLLETPDWKHPAEVLDPEGEKGISYEELIHIAAARIPRAEDPAPLEAVREKLERALSEKKTKKKVPWVEVFIDRLLKVEPKDAEGLLQRIGREYRSRRAASWLQEVEES